MFRCLALLHLTHCIVADKRGSTGGIADKRGSTVQPPPPL